MSGCAFLFEVSPIVDSDEPFSSSWCYKGHKRVLGVRELSSSWVVCNDSSVSPAMASPIEGISASTPVRQGDESSPYLTICTARQAVVAFLGKTPIEYPPPRNPRP